MVQFGKRLLNSQCPVWKDYYLDYEALKGILMSTIFIQRAKSSGNLIEMMEDGTDGEAASHARFLNLLDQQTEKIVLFFLQQQGVLAEQLAELRESSRAGKFMSDEDALQRYNQIGETIVLLVNFVEINVTGLQKILKKHDKHFHHYPIEERYLVRHHDSSIDSHLQQMYHYGGIAALTETLRQGLMDIEGAHSITTYSTLVKTPSWDDEKPILAKIHTARRRLKQSSGYARAMAMKAFIVDCDSEDNDSNRDLFPDKPSHKLSNALNLMSSFLYMTNYYIVAPTSGSYAARLGMSEALAGVIIGMTPCAALVASVLYSWWSNHSYKNALLFSAGCAVLGDVLYALALPFNSLTLILLGRLLNGFGGARAVNRRYIADAYSRNDRTAASAAFVTSSALGMAAGPALAVIGDLFTPTTPSTTSWWTVETAPGYIMFVLWVTYFITCWLYFEEPERKSHEQVSGVTTDKTPLLHYQVAKIEPVKSTALWKNVPAMTTLIIYFVLKLVLECLMSSTATITTLYFHWNVTRSGVFLAMLGLLMFPANMVVAQLSRTYEDRDIIMGTLGIMLMGTIGIIPYSYYTKIQYMAFYIFIFFGANMLEGPNMSLLSKALPRKWAKGTFNSGLLATEAGTFGRVVGDFVISGAGLMGLEHVLKLTFIPTSVLVAVTLLSCWKLYPLLEEIDEDDE